MKKYKKIILIILAVILIGLGGVGIYIAKNANDLKNDIIYNIESRNLSKAYEQVKESNEYILTFIENDIMDSFDKAVIEDFIDIDMKKLPWYLEEVYPNFFSLVSGYRSLGKELGMEKDEYYILITRLDKWKESYYRNRITLLYQKSPSSDKISNYIENILSSLKIRDFQSAHAQLEQFLKEFHKVEKEICDKHPNYAGIDSIIESVRDTYNSYSDYYNAIIYNDVNAFEEAKSRLMDSTNELIKYTEDSIDCLTEWSNIFGFLN